jgi:(2Fe-2S) ferredoxin
MEQLSPTHIRLILVCCNQKDVNDPKLCGNNGSLEIHAELKEYVRSKGLNRKIRVVKSGCLDYCGLGPIICIEPEHVWFKGVTKEDLSIIKEKYIDSMSIGQDLL